MAGAAAGDRIENEIPGLPHDEVYVYEDALRQGRTVVFVEVEDEPMLSAPASAKAFRTAVALSAKASKRKRTAT